MLSHINVVYFVYNLSCISIYLMPWERHMGPMKCIVQENDSFFLLDSTFYQVLSILLKLCPIKHETSPVSTYWCWDAWKTPYLASAILYGDRNFNPLFSKLVDLSWGRVLKWVKKIIEKNRVELVKRVKSRVYFF